MEKITITKYVYKFNELSEEAKNRILEEHINFLIDTTDFGKISKKTNLYRAFKKCEELQTPWFIGSYIYDYCKNSILKEVKKYKYFENGEFYE